MSDKTERTGAVFRGRVIKEAFGWAFSMALVGIFAWYFILTIFIVAVLL